MVDDSQIEIPDPTRNILFVDVDHCILISNLSLSLSLFKKKRAITNATPLVDVPVSSRVVASWQSFSRQLSGRRMVSLWSLRRVWMEEVEAIRLSSFAARARIFALVCRT